MQFATECAYDYLFVYDGASQQTAKLLASLSGLMTSPAPPPPSSLVASSGAMLVVLFSDTNYVMQGFQAEYHVHDCPRNCSGRGKCVDSKCHCDNLFGGDDCSRHLCP